MKKLSIEEKAKAYDEAYKVAEGIHSYSSNPGEIKRMEQIFPALKVSEDERIMEEIFNIIKSLPLSHERTEMLCWLEKQVAEPNWCHHKVDLSHCSEEYCKAYYDGWNNCNMQHYQCELDKSDVLKCLINGMKFYYEDNEEATWGTEKFSMKVKDILSWLEKQSQQKPVESQSEKELTESYLAVFDKKYPILPTLKGKQLADFKNFLNKCQQEFGLKNYGIHPTQSKLFEKLTLLWATWGAEHLQGIGKSEIEDIPTK